MAPSPLRSSRLNKMVARSGAGWIGTVWAGAAGARPAGGAATAEITAAELAVSATAAMMRVLGDICGASLECRAPPIDALPLSHAPRGRPLRPSKRLIL